MTTITNYSTLVTAVQEVTEDDSTEFLAYVPKAIDLAEERLFRELELPELLENFTGSTSTGVENITKPSGYEFAEHFILRTSDKRIVLKKKKYDFIEDYWPDKTETGIPKYYADKTDMTFVLAPVPDNSYTYEIRYTKQPTKLSTSNTTNYFINKCKDVLFAACVYEMCIFMKNDPETAVWENKYTNLRDTWNIQAMRYRRDGNMTANSQENLQNSLKHTMGTNA